MNPKGARSLLSSKVKLGADASAAAGPKGRSSEAATDVVMNAEILSYSRAKGLFAGISLEGSCSSLVKNTTARARESPSRQGVQDSYCDTSYALARFDGVVDAASTHNT
jgi:hypothetical protein